VGIIKGLSESYDELAAGTFACAPPRIRGVEIVEGYYKDSLTPALARRVGRVSLASVDCDLHSSTLCALRWLTPLLGTGSLLLFDEFLGGQEAEKRAFEEWSDETGIRTIRVAQFLREPSGGRSATLDERALFQVVGDVPHQPRRVVTIGGVVSKARAYVAHHRHRLRRR
jgi:hypothetical protein